MTVVVTAAFWTHLSLAAAVVVADYSERPLIGFPLMVAFAVPLLICWAYVERIAT